MIGLPLQFSKLNYQLHSLITRQNPANLFRRYQRHHFVIELKTFAEGQTGGHASNHGGHTGLSHRRRFDDGGRKRRLPGIAKGQQEMRHATADAVRDSFHIKRLKRRRDGSPKVPSGAPVSQQFTHSIAEGI
jgi:hypothetical protein